MEKNKQVSKDTENAIMVMVIIMALTFILAVIASVI